MLTIIIKLKSNFVVSIFLYFIKGGYMERYNLSAEQVVKLLYRKKLIE